MSEFHQYSTIATLHNLYEIFDVEEYLHSLERKLEGYSDAMRICLVLPSLYSELDTPGVLQNIVNEINRVNYLHEVVIAYNGSDNEKHFRRACDFFGQLRKPDRDVKMVWVDGPRVQKVMRKIESHQIDTGVPGKGQSVWITLGYIYARRQSDVIALHDCDIVTYDRLLLGRLIEPTANPNNDFEFCKGYYARISLEDQEMKGRATRIFVAPFVQTLADLMRKRGETQLEGFFRYHRCFRYPLAGEVSFATRLGRSLNVANDWALEVSTLSDIYQRTSLRKVAQVDLARNYDHKHKSVSENDASGGLHKMVVDIAKFFLNHMRSNGCVLNDDFIRMLQNTYRHNAWFFIKKYADDASINNLVFERHKEELTANHFVNFIGEAWDQIQAGQVSEPIPSWNRVAYSFPGIYADLIEAVEADNA